VPQLTSDVHLPEHAVKALTEAEMFHMKSARIVGVLPLALFSSFVAAFLLDQFYRKLSEFKLKEVTLPEK
jgi:hypothetical protein